MQVIHFTYNFASIEYTHDAESGGICRIEILLEEPYDGLTTDGFHVRLNDAKRLQRTSKV